MRAKQTVPARTHSSSGGSAPRVNLPIPKNRPREVAAERVPPNEDRHAEDIESRMKRARPGTPEGSASKRVRQRGPGNVNRTTGGVRAASEGATEETESTRHEDDTTNLQSTSIKCSFCLDGGLLYDCNNCLRAVCSECIDVPSEYEEEVSSDDVQFQCVACYWKANPITKDMKPYMGFTRRGVPVLPSFLQVNGEFDISTAAQVTSPKTLIINLSLDSPSVLSPAALLEYTLVEYLPADQLDIATLPFDLGTNAKAADWPARVVNKLRSYSSRAAYQHVIVLIANRTDGGLSWGKDGFGGMVSGRVGHFLEILLNPFKSFLPGAITYLVGGGSIVRQSEPFKTLCKVLRNFKIGHALTFDASCLVPHLLARLLMKVTQKVVINQQEFVGALEGLLLGEGEVGEHTSIFHVALDTATRYTWTHRDIQPWGERVPIQCPVCGVVQKWASVSTENDSYLFECANEKCGWQKGKKVVKKHQFWVARPREVELLHENKVPGQSWMKMPYAP